MSAEELSVENRLKTYIETVRSKQLEHEADQLVGKHLVRDLAMDSLDIMNLLFQIEEKESVEITEADMEANALSTFGKLADHIRQAKEGAA